MTVQEWLGKDNFLGIDIWERKYKHENETFDQWLDRVSNQDAALKELIVSRRFLFGGRILSNRGLHKTGKKITYSNCYVVTPPEDNIESIFECASKLARTFSYGGGVGIDISKLSPRGARVNNTAKETSGAVSFMDLYSLVTGLIGQNGRRGALMISIACDHPDLEEFIEIKSDLSRVTKANISIRVTNAFLEAVKNGEDFPLSFTREETGETITKVVNAREIFTKIAQTNWDYAEPGFLYWDRIKEWNLLSNTKEFEFAGTNPCAEEPLPAGGSCLLGSLNLSEFVQGKAFQFEEFHDAVQIAVKALNDVLEEGLPLHPLPEQKESVKNWRQIGLGIFGLADMLIKMELEYGSEKSLELCSKIGFEMADTSIRTSARLAKERGAYEKCNVDEIMRTPFFIQNTSQKTVELVKEYGIRNSQLLTIAPTGTLSTMLGVSGGIEPIFANYYERKTESLHDKDVIYKVYTPIVEKYRKQNKIVDDKYLPTYFVTAQTLRYDKRINMQSIWQGHIDASISSTVNVPQDFSVEDTESLYLYAYEKGLKGVTIFRDGCKRTGILTTNGAAEEESSRYNYIVPISRKKIGTTHGCTYCKKCACGTLYVTINKDSDDNIVESFVHTSKGGICQANISAVNRMISLNLRTGVKVEEIIDQLQGINCPACVKVATKGEQIDGMSCPDIIARTIKDFAGEADKWTEKALKTDEFCPECGEKVNFEGGCVICTNCGWSKCN